MDATTGSVKMQQGGALTPEEASLLRAYRMLDNRAQGMIGRLTSLYAKDFPRYQRPALRLVAGGAA